MLAVVVVMMIDDFLAAENKDSQLVSLALYFLGKGWAQCILTQ